MSNYLPLGIRNILQKTGWTENEISVYSTLIERGPMDLTTISRETNMGISTIQYVLKKLISKKMLSKTTVNGKPTYAVSDVDKLRKWAKGYVKQFEHFEDTVRKFIDQYSCNPTSFTSSKIRFYEGGSGVKQSYRDMAEECDQTEMVGFHSPRENKLDDSIAQEYRSSLEKKGIKTRNIALNSNALESICDECTILESMPLSEKENQKCNTEISISGGHFHCSKWNGKEGFALIIQVPYVSSILRAAFEMAWNQSKNTPAYQCHS